MTADVAEEISARSRRLTGYCEAVASTTCPITTDELDTIVHAVVALADAEQAEHRATIGRLHAEVALAGRIHAHVEKTHATVLEQAGVTGGRSLHLLVDSAGYDGLIHVHDDLAVPVDEDLVDGGSVPLVRWDLSVYRALDLVHALEVLDEVSELMAAGVEGPGIWVDERNAVREAVEHLVRVGRIIRDSETGQIRFPATEGEPEL